MNINDVTTERDIPEAWQDIIVEIFDRQKQLMAKYKEIEQLPAAPVSLHTASGQRVIKDFAWRTVEELTESFEAFEKHPGAEVVARQHALEELADSVHFFVELLVFAGISPIQCYTRTGHMPKLVFNEPSWAYWQFTYKLGVAMNFLRNKAWKKSQIPTDEARFREAILNAWDALIDVWGSLDCTQDDLYTYYFKKSDVNAFRQRSNY
jgi:hypothetical protein